MTTIVYDGAKGVLAADTRWSKQIPGYFIWIDEPLCPKIANLDTPKGSFAFLFAGFGATIQVWKDWIKSNPSSLDGRPEPHGMATCIVNRATLQMKSLGKGRVDTPRSNIYFAGTGGSYAYSCFSQNSCAKLSVATASSMDKATGGVVHYLDIAAEDHNFLSLSGQRELSIFDVSQLILTEGMVMKTTSKVLPDAPFKLKDAVNDDAENLRDIQAQLASGSIALDAPCDSMHGRWSDEEVTELDKTLTEIFGF